MFEITNWAFKELNFVHQEAYIANLLKKFYIGKLHSLCIPIVVRSLDVSKDSLWPREKDQELPGPKAHYLSAIGKLMFLANFLIYRLLSIY